MKYQEMLTAKLRLTNIQSLADRDKLIIENTNKYIAKTSTKKTNGAIMNVQHCEKIAFSI